MGLFTLITYGLASYVFGWYAGYLTGRLVAAQQQQALAKSQVQTKDLYPKE